MKAFNHSHLAGLVGIVGKPGLPEHESGGPARAGFE